MKKVIFVCDYKDCENELPEKPDMKVVLKTAAGQKTYDVCTDHYGETKSLFR